MSESREVAVRGIDADLMVPIDSKHPIHANMFKTVVLLKITSTNGPIYFVVEGCASFEPRDQFLAHQFYYYEEHTCPTNFCGVEKVFFNGDDDPHGVFEFVDAVWMTESYLAAQRENTESAWMRKAFPHLSDGQ